MEASSRHLGTETQGLVDGAQLLEHQVVLELRNGPLSGPAADQFGKFAQLALYLFQIHRSS